MLVEKKIKATKLDINLTKSNLILTTLQYFNSNPKQDCKNMETESKIIISTPDHAECLVRFQCQMALETEHLKLEEQLVRKAIHYLDQKQGYGFYFVGLNTEEPDSKELPIISSLMLTYEHEQSWWILSVYVDPKYRRKGHFKKLFERTIKTATEKGVKLVRLYAEKDNERAKDIYIKLGMHITGQLFYGFDMVYSKHKPDLDLEQGIPSKLVPMTPKDKGFTGWEDFKKEYLPYNEFECILENTASVLNKSLCLYGKDNKLIGFCQHFYEFSEWRCCFISYVNVLYVAKNSQIPEKVIAKIFMNQLLEKLEGLQIRVIRFLIRPEQLTKIQKCVPNGAVDDYDILAIQI